MKTIDAKYRVLYADTDAMGIVYYANYLRFYEMGRDAYFRALNVTEEEIRDSGILLPAVSVNMKYIKPAEYKDDIIIKTQVIEMPAVRFRFEQSVYHNKKGLLNKADIVLASVDAKSMKPLPCPLKLRKAIEIML
ncbi:MAG: acyl-CoA thioesterase [Bacteroidales bacterium]